MVGLFEKHGECAEDEVHEAEGVCVVEGEDDDDWLGEEHLERTKCADNYPSESSTFFNGLVSRPEGLIARFLSKTFSLEVKEIWGVAFFQIENTENEDEAISD